MIPHFVILLSIFVRYYKQISFNSMFVICFLFLLGINILNMSLRGSANLVDYFYLLGFALIISSISLLAQLLDKLDIKYIQDFISYSYPVSLVLIFAIFFSFFFGGDAQRGNPAVIMNRNLFSIFLIIYFYLNDISAQVNLKAKAYSTYINICLFGCIVLVGSRAAILGICVYLFVKSKRFRFFFLFLVTLLISISIDVAELNLNILRRFYEIFYVITIFLENNGEGLENIKRVSLLLTALSVLQDNWLFGIGAGSNLYRSIAMSYSPSGYVASPHNLWLSLVISFGILQTLVLFLYFRQKLKSNNTGILSTTNVSLIFAFLTVWCFNQYILVPYYVVIFAFMHITYKLDKRI